MARELFDYPDSRWQSLCGDFPSALLDTHPRGEFVAMQVLLYEEVTTERAAIWNTKTRKIHWNPGNVNALCWVEDGNEILVLEKIQKEGVLRPPHFATPTQSEYKHLMRRMSWPGLETISFLELKFPMGWPIDIVSSPTDKLTCFVWQDQCESGIEYVSWKEGDLHQLLDIGFCKANSNLIQGPVFNPDGTAIAIAFGAGVWWAETPDKPSQGGEFPVGSIIFSETGSGKYIQKDIFVNIPEGWRPKDPTNSVHNEYLPAPIFLSSHEIKIELPTGEIKLISF